MMEEIRRIDETKVRVLTRRPAYRRMFVPENKGSGRVELDEMSLASSPGTVIIERTGDQLLINGRELDSRPVIQDPEPLYAGATVLDGFGPHTEVHAKIQNQIKRNLQNDLLLHPNIGIALSMYPDLLPHVYRTDKQGNLRKIRCDRIIFRNLLRETYCLVLEARGNNGWAVCFEKTPCDIASMHWLSVKAVRRS